MQDLIRKMSSLVADIEVKNKELDGLVSKNTSLKVSLAKKAETLSALEKDLKSREGKCKIKEDIEAAQEKAIKEQKEAKKGLAELKTRGSALDETFARNKREQESKIVTLDNSIKANEASKKKYDAAVEDLDEEKKNVKEAVLKELAGKIK